MGSEVSTVSVDFTKTVGRIKPMNAGNNGPKIPRGDQTSGNFETFKMLHIPYARLHDANLCVAYGAPHTIDVRAIFKDFKADPDDPANYDFTMTDVYLKSLERAGTEPYYRLGGSIEHNPRKWFTCVPPDFRKFAVICEHIIRHCCDDWADGLNMKITYWEIWNEPDIDADDSPNKRCWQGTSAEFIEMFCITAVHLKKCFPNLKMGGPASVSPINEWNDHWTDKFFAALTKNGIKLDFYSWHCYASAPKHISEAMIKVRSYMDEHGQKQAESILNEWNYVKGWSDEWVYSLEQEAKIKGAAMALCVMLAGQKLPIDILMYYDMRVSCGMNGLWHPVTFDRQKPWFSYFMFEKLAALKNEVESQSDDADVYAVAAQGKNGKKAIVIGTYSDDDNPAFKHIAIKVKGLEKADRENVSVRLLDEKNDCIEVPFQLERNTITLPFNVRSCAGLLIQF